MALNDWEARLRRLGVVKGVRNLKLASPVVDSDQLSVLSTQQSVGKCRKSHTGKNPMGIDVA